MKFHILLFAGVCLILTPLYILALKPWRQRTQLLRIRKWLVCLFFVFMTGLLFMTFWAIYPPFDELWTNAVSRMQTGKDISFVPFHNIMWMYHYDNREHFIMNMLGNTLMFIPWGYLRPLLWKKQQKPIRIIAGALLLTLFIETFQLFTTNRTVDIDDIILNTLGSLAGAGLWSLSIRIFPGLKKLAK